MELACPGRYKSLPCQVAAARHPTSTSSRVPATMRFLSLLLLSLPFTLATPLPAAFDLEGHRGGRGENSEETLFSYARALLAGVTTLELDIGITSDGVPVVWHDEMIMKEKCIGEGVGEYIKELSFEQVRCMCLASFCLAPHRLFAGQGARLRLAAPDCVPEAADPPGRAHPVAAAVL